MPKKLTPEEYKVYFEKNYPDYELLSDYQGNKNYITVRCKKDGNIWNTKPNWLQHGAGCQKCYDRRRGKTTMKSKEEFIKQANQVHNNTYDYSKTVYKGNKIPVTIICPKHGEFEQTPNKHLMGHGCPKCANERNGLNKRTPNETYINRCSEIHNGKYSYDKTNYQGWDKPVIITCPIHGDFVQMAGVHLSGCGCPACNESHLEKYLFGFLSKNNFDFERQKRFPWLKAQSLDFYLPDINVGIECQGIQHFMETLYNSKESNLEKIIERDERKKNLCEENGVTLIYYTKDKKIFNASPIYTEKNTFFSLTSLNEFLKTVNSKTLFEDIVNDVLGKLE